MNTNDVYIKRIVPLLDQECRCECLRLITINGTYKKICDYEAMKSFLVYSDYVMFFHRQSSIEDIVGFVLLKHRIAMGVLEIVLMCTKDTTEYINSMIVYNIFNCAIRLHHCMRMVVSPGTYSKLLWRVFLRHGFTSMYGYELDGVVDDVFEKFIDIIEYDTAKKAYHIRRVLNVDLESEHYEYLFDFTNTEVSNAAVSDVAVSEPAVSEKLAKYTLRKSRRNHNHLGVTRKVARWRRVGISAAQ